MRINGSKLVTFLFICFGAAIVGWVVLFASSSKKQYDHLHDWAKKNEWTIEHPGERTSFRITGKNKSISFVIEAIQGDKNATPSLNAKPKTVLTTSFATTEQRLLLTPHLPDVLFKTQNFNPQNKNRLFYYILGEEADDFKAIKPLKIESTILSEHFSAFANDATSLAVLTNNTFIEKVVLLRQTLGHSPIITIGKNTITIRSQKLVFGPNILNEMIETATTLIQLLQTKINE